MRHTPHLVAMLFAPVAMMFAACGNSTKHAATPTPAISSAITMVNETPCVLHFRFDNGIDRGTVQPGTTKVFDDPLVAASRYVKFEATYAIFRTFDLATIRANGDRIVVRPALDDGACVEPIGG